MKKKLAIIGASYLQLPLVIRAKEMNIEVHCFAWEEGAVCKEIADFFYPISTIEKEEILEVCKKIKIDGVTSIASDIAVPTVNYIAMNLGLTGNDPINSMAYTNKYLMREKFKQGFVNSPNFCKIAKGDSTFLCESFSYPLIVKPVDRSGSRGVQMINLPVELNSAILRAQEESFNNECIVEEFIEGCEVSVESISWKGKHYILAITDKETTGSPYFVELAHHQPTILESRIQEKIIIESTKALESLNIEYGASHSEFKITNDGNVFAIEVGARMGGDFIGSDLVYLSTGYDFVKGVIEIALGGFDIPDTSKKKYSGVFFLSKERESLKSIILNWKSLQIIRAEITDNETRLIKCSADRSGYLIYQSDQRIEYCHLVSKYMS